MREGNDASKPNLNWKL